MERGDMTGWIFVPGIRTRLGLNVVQAIEAAWYRGIAGVAKDLSGSYCLGSARTVTDKYLRGQENPAMGLHMSMADSGLLGVSHSHYALGWQGSDKLRNSVLRQGLWQS